MTAQRALFVDLPDGLRPTAMRGRVSLSPDVSAATLSLYSDEQLLAATTVTSETNGETVVLAIPSQTVPALAERLASGEGFPLTLRSTLDGGGNECVAEAIGSQIAFDEVEILVEGQPGPPQTLNDFFGPVPGQVTLVTGPDPDRHATDVAMVLAAGVTNRYGAAATRIGVQEGDATPTGVFDRVVRIDPDTDGLALSQDDPPILLVGRGSTPDQLGLLFNELSVLASVASTTVLELDQVNQLDRTSLSLVDLGVSELQTKGPGVNDVTFPISQTALGGPTGDVVLRLSGTHTPVDDGRASLSILVDGLQLQTEELQGGEFDVVVAIPDVSLKREFTVTARFANAAEDGRCEVGAAPFTAQINPRSSLDFTRNQVFPAGFERFPQNLLDDLPVYVPDNDIHTLDVVTGVITGLQSMSEVLLQPHVVDDVPADGDVVVISPDGSLTDRLRAPLRDGGTQVVGRDGQAVLQVSDAVDASLQAFRAQGRDILLASGSEASEIVDRLAVADDGWFSLRGDTAVLSGGGVTSLRLVDGSVVTQPLGSGSRGWLARNRPVVFLAALVLLVLLLAAVYPRLVRPGVATERPPLGDPSSSPGGTGAAGADAAKA